MTDQEQTTHEEDEDVKMEYVESLRQQPTTPTKLGDFLDDIGDSSRYISEASLSDSTPQSEAHTHNVLGLGLLLSPGQSGSEEDDDDEEEANPPSPVLRNPLDTSSAGNTSLSSRESPAAHAQMSLHISPEYRRRLELDAYSDQGLTETRLAEVVAPQQQDSNGQEQQQTDTAVIAAAKEKQSDSQPNSSRSTSSSLSNNTEQRVADFFDDLKIQSVGALREAGPEDFDSDRNLARADGQQIGAVMRTRQIRGARPRRSSGLTEMSEVTCDLDSTVVMSLSASEGEEDETTKSKAAKTEDERQSLDWEHHHSADDEGTETRPHRKRVSTAGGRGGKGHRRTRSGDAVAAAVMTGGNDWVGMQKTGLPIPEEHDDDDEEDTTEDDQYPIKTIGSAGSNRSRNKGGGRSSERGGLKEAPYNDAIPPKPARPRQRNRIQASRVQQDHPEYLNTSMPNMGWGLGYGQPSSALGVLRGGVPVQVNLERQDSSLDGSISTLEASGRDSASMRRLYSESPQSRRHQPPIHTDSSSTLDASGRDTPRQLQSESPVQSTINQSPGQANNKDANIPLKDSLEVSVPTQNANGRSAIPQVPRQTYADSHAPQYIPRTRLMSGTSSGSEFSWISGMGHSNFRPSLTPEGQHDEFQRTSFSVEDGSDSEGEASDGERARATQNRLNGTHTAQGRTSAEPIYESRSFRSNAQNGIRSPFSPLLFGDRGTVNIADFKPMTTVVDDGEKEYPTFVCPQCGLKQREFFTSASAPSQFESPAGYLALYFAIYVIASLYIFGLQEGWPALDCVYFAVITLTTAGLGDFVPTSDSAKIVCSIFIYFGVACIGLLLGSYIASMLDEKSYVEAQKNRVNNCAKCSRLPPQPVSVRGRQRFGGTDTSFRGTKNSFHMSMRPVDYTASNTPASFHMSKRSSGADSGSDSGSGHARVRNGEKRAKPHRQQAHQGPPSSTVSSASMSSRNQFHSESPLSSYSAPEREKPSVPGFNLDPYSTPTFPSDRKTAQNSDLTIQSSGSNLDVIDAYAGRTLPYDPQGSYMDGASPAVSSISPRSPQGLGSPMTRNILGRQSHTRHQSMDIGNDPTVFGYRRPRNFSDDLTHQQPSTIYEGVQQDQSTIQMSIPWQKADVDDGDVADEEAEDDDDVLSSSSSEYSDESEVLQPPSKIKTAKYVFLTLKQALMNSTLIILIGGMGFYFIEKMTVVDSFYFTTVLLTTVGYGDITPVTNGGKLFATVYVLVAGTVLLHNMSMISYIPLELRKRRIERAVLTQFGDQLDDAALKELAVGPLVQRLQLSMQRVGGLDQCNREMFALAMLVRLGKVTEKDVHHTFAAFRRLDVDDDGVLNSKTIIAGMALKRRSSRVNLAAEGEEQGLPPPPPLNEVPEQEEPLPPPLTAEHSNYWFGRHGSLHVRTGDSSYRFADPTRQSPDPGDSETSALLPDTRNYQSMGGPQPYHPLQSNEGTDNIGLIL